VCLGKINHDFSWKKADYKHHISVICIMVLLLLCQLLSLQHTLLTCALISVGMIVFIDFTISHTCTHARARVRSCTLMWSKYLSRFIFVCGIIIIWILYWWSNIVMLLYLLWQLSLCDKTDCYQKPNKTLQEQCTGWIPRSFNEVLFIYLFMYLFVL